MRRYLLDTGPLNAFLFNRPGALALIAPWIRNQEATSSILVYGEVVEHIKGQPNFPAHHQALRTLLQAVYPYFLTYSILERYADIRRQLRPANRLIGDIDTLIAATALERHLTVVTIDGDYQRVPGLNVMLLTRADLVGSAGP